MPNLEYPVLRAAVNNQIETNYVSDLSLMLSSGNHDVATLSVNYLTPPGLSRANNLTWQRSVGALWKDNSLVQIDYGRFGQQTSWYGYLAGKEQVHNPELGTSTVQVNYYCTGTSKPMQNQTTKTWTKVSPSFIARTIAQKYNLRPMVEAHPLVLASRSQTGISDFAFLRDLAAEIGYRFWVSGASLYFTNPYSSFLTGNSPYIPAFTLDKQPGSFDTLRDFVITDGPQINDGGVIASREMFVINPSTNATVHAENNFLRYSAFNDAGGSPMAVNTIVKQDRTADSYNEAMALLAADAAANRFWVTSKAGLWGDARVLPGNAVSLSGVAMSPDNAGSWMVSNCTHRLHVGLNDLGSEYWIDACLGRDQEHIANFKTVADIRTTTVDPEANNGTWRSSTLNNGLSNVG